MDQPGANARFHAVDERLVGLKPGSLSFTEAAALPLTSLTAWEGLFGRLKPADGPGTLLVTAAAGGVGAMVVQLARACTALTVIGTASRPETAAYARRMGAHHIVDHHRPLGPQLAEVAPGGIDYVFSTTGTERNLAAYADALKPFGAIVAIDDPDTLAVGVLKPKSLAFHWEFMFTRSMFATPDRQDSTASSPRSRAWSTPAPSSPRPTATSARSTRPTSAKGTGSRPPAPRSGSSRSPASDGTRPSGAGVPPRTAAAERTLPLTTIRRGGLVDEAAAQAALRRTLRRSTLSITVDLYGHLTRRAARETVIATAGCSGGGWGRRSIRCGCSAYRVTVGSVLK